MRDSLSASALLDAGFAVRGALRRVTEKKDSGLGRVNSYHFSGFMDRDLYLHDKSKSGITLKQNLLPSDFDHAVDLTEVCLALFVAMLASA